MADNVSPTDPVGAASVADRPQGVASFLATTTGKLVVGGVLLLVLLGVLAAIFFGFFGSGSSGSPATGTGVVIKPSTNSTGTVAQTPVNPEEAPLSDSFTFRPNIFAPTVSLPASTPASVATSAGASTSGGSDGTDSALVLPKVPANTLFLQSIQAVNDTNQATLIWNGEAFVVGAGQAVGDTPWKVLSISDTSVVMLFGDDRVTISVGQGLSK